MVKQHRTTRVKSMSAKAISDILARSAAVKLATAERCSDDAFEASRMIATALESGGKIMFCGNGGSAGDAQHLAAEFVSTLDHQRPRAGLAAIALTTDTSFITAYSNDFGFDGIFSRQVETLAGKMMFLLDFNEWEFKKCRCCDECCTGRWHQHNCL